MSDGNAIDADDVVLLAIRGVRRQLRPPADRRRCNHVEAKTPNVVVTFKDANPYPYQI